MQALMGVKSVSSYMNSEFIVKLVLHSFNYSNNTAETHLSSMESKKLIFPRNSLCFGHSLCPPPINLVSIVCVII